MHSFGAVKLAKIWGYINFTREVHAPVRDRLTAQELGLQQTLHGSYRHRFEAV
jgi:hypothetical protein